MKERLTIIDFVEKYVAKYSKNPFLWEKNLDTDQWEKTTYAETLAKAKRIAAGLMALGVQKGEKVSYLSEGRDMWVIGELGVLYAGAQKNMGPAGVAVAIYKRGSILPDIDPIVPSLLRYEEMEKTGSMLNTPPTFAIYMCGLVYKWVEEQGGVSELEKLNKLRIKAEMPPITL